MVIFVDPSSRIWVHRSRKGSLLSFSDSIVNLMCGSMLFMCSVNSSTSYSWSTLNVSSTYRSHSDGGCGAVAIFSNCHFRAAG